MIFSRLKSKIEAFYRFVIAPPKVWGLPGKSDVLIFDACGKEELAPYLSKYRPSVLATRRESINVLCVLRASLSLNFWKGKTIKSYFDAYIQAVSPKLVVTFIDNNTDFYCISKQFPDIKTILCQNGIRGELGDVFEHLRKSDDYHVDYMLVMGNAIGKKYSTYISGSILANGSLMNNHVNYKYVEPDGSILFISQYRNKPKNNAPFFTDIDNKPFYYDQFYSAEAIVLKFLIKWCICHNKFLKIAGVSIENSEQEIAFFETFLSGYAWEYIPRSDQYSSYRSVDAAEIVVFIDSTLGYEAAARGKKTASFSCRGVNPNNGATRFGWPADIPNNGPFWSSDQDEMQFLRVMDYLNTVSAEEWEQTRKCYMSEIMEFDPGNTRFVALLEQLLSKTYNILQK